MADLTINIRFGEDFPKARTGFIMPDRRTVITGHDRGLVVVSDIETGKSSILDDCHLDITTLACPPGEEILVGCHDGLIYSFPLRDPTRKRTIQEPGFTKASRVWRLLWLDSDTFLMSSNYGVLTAFSRNAQGGWDKKPLAGHAPHAIFGLEKSSENTFASGDWLGKVLVWEATGPEFHLHEQLIMQGGVQAIAWHSGDTLAAVDRGGRIHVFESTEQAAGLHAVYETNTASSMGQCIHLTDDGNTVFAGTQTELIQFDIDSQYMMQTDLNDVRAVFSDDAKVYIITADSIRSGLRKKVEIPAKFISYQYVKVSLLGHTGVGKSTLCSNFVNGSVEGIESTFGKRIWQKDLGSAEGSPPRKIILHDHGGQETVLETFLPFLTDSDVILLFFKQTDFETFKSAVHILEELEQMVGKKTKVFLVRTFRDQKMGDIDEAEIKSLIDEKRIIDCLELDARNLAEVNRITDRVMQEVSWKSAKTMTESQYVEGLTKTILDLQQSRSMVVPVEEMAQIFEKRTGIRISKTHARFLLRNFSTQGIVEYYPEVLDSVIINDDRYNQLRTTIPIYVRNQNGIVRIDELHKKFSPQEYVDILDRVYLEYQVSIENDGLRIFPGNLKKEGMVIPEPCKSLLASDESNSLSYTRQPVKLGGLFGALSDMKLACVAASQNGGVFAWENYACIYFFYEESNDAITGDFIKFTYYIGGVKADRCDRLRTDFPALLGSFYGQEITSASKKKNTNLT